MCILHDSVQLAVLLAALTIIHMDCDLFDKTRRELVYAGGVKKGPGKAILKVVD